MSRNFIDAAAGGDAARVQSYLDKGLAVDWHDARDGVTALWAAAGAHFQVVRLLLDHGADVNRQDLHTGNTPLANAAKNGQHAIVNILLQKGAKPNIPCHGIKLTPLMWAAGNGHALIIKLLLDDGADRNAIASDGRTALTIARTNKQARTARLLEEAGAQEGTVPMPPAPRSDTIAWPKIDKTGKTSDCSSPETVLRGFICAMNLWEKQMAKLDKTKGPTLAVDREMDKSLAVVFKKFCTPKKRPYGRGGSYQIPPEYNPANEFLIGVNLANPRRAVLTTRDKTHENEYRYVVLKQLGRWLVDSKKVVVAGKSLPACL